MGFRNYQLLRGGTGTQANNTIGGINSTNRPFDGSMDGVRIYSRALSAAEVLAIYNARN